MTGLPPRARTQSKWEEENVTGFVDATVNFKTNCDFAAYSAAADFANASHVLFLAQGVDAAKKAFAGNAVFDNADVQAALGSAAEGKTFAVGSVSGKRVLVGLVPSKASRHNCPVRPDVITSLVTEALGDGKKVTALDVVSAFDAGFQLAVAQAVAKASHSFSAKSGQWANSKGYAKELTPVKTYLQGPLKATADDLKAVAESIQIAARLVDAPTNLLDTTTYPQIAQGFAKRFGFECSVIAGEDLREQGYGGLYGVGKAAEFQASLVTLTYTPQTAQKKEKIALVGKGMVYDCGGLAIKTPAPFMCGMKADMGGSAAVFGGFLAAVQLKSEHPLNCVLCIADNAISARAQRNDDIVIMKSGRTVQINNTDAEGRLILGDGVWHAAKCCGETPAMIMTQATLTGAQGVATGQKHAGIYTNCGDSESRMVKIGKQSGDVCHPFVYCPEFHEPEFACKGSDQKNLMARVNNASSACAGWFIESNLPEDFKGKFVHLDIAFPAVDAELGTGYGVAMLSQMLGPQFQ